MVYGLVTLDRVAPAAALDVVVVAYRCRALLDFCLASLPAAAGALELHVVVADNDSRDGTVELVRERHPAVTLVEMGGNTGFARATNTGIRLGAAPWVLALNPDTRLEPGSLERLVHLAERLPGVGTDRVGVVGCRLVLDDGSFDHAARRSFPTVLGTLGHVTGLGRLPGAPAALAQYRAPGVESGRVDAVNGAFMLLRRQAVEAAGLFDEGYWMYFEDLDLCKRLADLGWATWYEGSVTAVHVKHGTSGARRAPRLDAAFHYGFRRFWRRCLADRHAAPVNALVAGAIWAGLAVSVARWAAWRVGQAATGVRTGGTP